MHELLHRKDFLNGDMFKDTVYNRHMKIYPEVFKLRKELEFSKDDAEIYLNKYLSTKDNKKLEENWIPKR